MLHPCQMAFFLILILISRFLCIAKFYDRVWDIFWCIGVNEIKCCTTLWNVFSQRRFHCVGRLEKVHSRFLLFPPFPHFENFCQDLMARVSLFLPSFPHLQWAQKMNIFPKTYSLPFLFSFLGDRSELNTLAHMRGHVSLFGLLVSILRILNFPFTWIGLFEDKTRCPGVSEFGNKAISKVPWRLDIRLCPSLRVNWRNYNGEGILLFIQTFWKYEGYNDRICYI